MNTPELSTGLDPELLDDFFAEAEQHLIDIRHGLVQLEASIGKRQSDPKVLKELFQSVHSFKGISAIAGLAPAEALAHATEDYLRSLTRSQTPLTQKGVELLMTAAHKLEQMVSAFRSHKPIPAPGSLLAELKQEHLPRTEAGPPKDGSPEGGRSGTTASEMGPGWLWKFTFVPSRQLEAQGINVKAIREQLSEVGEIVTTTPIVGGPEALAFEFVVKTHDTVSDSSQWESKGVTLELLRAEQEEPSAVSGAEHSEHTPFLAPSHLVRVDLKRLDELMRITGEMVVHRSRLEAQMARLNATTRADLQGVQEVSGGLGRSLRELREAIMRVRMVRVAEIFSRLPFVVRDLARQSSKEVRLQLEGQDTMMDKYLIERLKDPLLHLVRNAFSHGIESPQERAEAGKPEQAVITLKASTSGDSVVLQVRDDGRGISSEAIAVRARQLGLPVPDTLDNQTILDLLCSSGFSTRQAADRIAGRGVGMTVVDGTVRELGGSLIMRTEEGQGTEFTIRLPLTLAIAETFIVSAVGQTCAVPQSFVTEILHFNEAQVQMVNGVELIPYQGGMLPIVRLAKLFNLPATQLSRYLLVITSDRGSVGLAIEEVLGRREIVVRALRDSLVRVPGVTGGTELGDGKPVLILDGAALTAGQVRPRQRAGREELRA